MNARRNLLRITLIPLAGFFGGFGCAFSASHFVVIAVLCLFALAAAFVIVSRSEPPLLENLVYAAIELLGLAPVAAAGWATATGEWSVTVAGTLLWIGLMIVAGPSVLVGGSLVEAHRRRRLKCPQCGYSLLGVGKHRCPECGRPFTLEELHASAADLQPPRRGS